MAEPQFGPQIETARRQGYSDDEILTHLSGTGKVDPGKVREALTSGHSAADILRFFGGSEQSLLPAGAEIRPPMPLGKRIARKVGEYAPFVGGILGAAAGGGPTPLGVAGAALGGVAGKAFGETVEDLAGLPVPQTWQEELESLGKAGLEQGAYELGGRVISGAARGLVKGFPVPAGRVAGAVVPSAAVRTMGQGLKMTAPELAGETRRGFVGRQIQRLSEFGILGRSLAQTAKTDTEREALKTGEMVASSLAKRTTPEVTGAKVADALASAAEGFRTRGKELFDQAVKSTGGVEVFPLLESSSTEGIKTEAEREAKVLAGRTIAGLGRSSSPEATGNIVKKGLSASLDAFRKRGEQYFERDLPRLGEGVPANFSSLATEARKLLAEPSAILKETGGPSRGGLHIEDLPANLQQKIMETMPATGTLPPETGVQKLLQTLSRLKSSGTFSEGLELRRFLERQTGGFGGGAFADRESQALARHFQGMLTDSLEGAAKDAGGELYPAWMKARNYWREGRAIYDSAVIQGLMNKDPELVAKAISPGEVTPVVQIRKALLGHGSLAGKEEREAGQRSWNVFRRQYVQSNLLGTPEGGVEKILDLPKRLEAAGPRQLQAVFGSDAEGRAILVNLRALAEKIKDPEALLGPYRQGPALLAPGRSLKSETVVEQLMQNSPQFGSLMEKVAKMGGPAAEESWKRASNYWNEGQSIFQSSVIQGLMKKNPELVAKAVAPGEVTPVLQIRKALLGHGALGNAEEKAVGQEAWRTFQRQYIQSNLFKDAEAAGIGNLENITGLKGRMEAAGPRQLQAIFGSDAQGRVALQNLRTLAETISRLQPVSTGIAHQMGRLLELGAIVGGALTGGSHVAVAGGATWEAVPYALSRILYSPRATALLIRGLELPADKAAIASGLITRAAGIAMHELLAPEPAKPGLPAQLPAVPGGAL